MGMKKIASVFMASAFLFGSVGIATAAEFKFSGTFNVATEYRRNSALDKKYANSFGAMQRFRPVLTATINENLYASLGLEIGTYYWGDPSGGARLGSDAMNIKVKNAYINWKMPGLTNMNIRMGIQNVTAPSATIGTAVLNDDVAGIAINYAITQNIGLNVTWARPFTPVGIAIDTASGAIGEGNADPGTAAIDYFQFELPLNFSGVNLTPWGSVLTLSEDSMGSLSGSAANKNNPVLMEETAKALHSLSKGLINNQLSDGANNDHFASGSGMVWWAGITLKITAVQNLTIGFDFTYGATDYDKNGNTTTNSPNYNPNREGFFTAVNIKYKLDSFTPGISYWYASGNKADARTKGGGIMPSVAGSYTPLLYAYDTSAIDIGGSNDLGGVYTSSSQGVALEAADITFIKDLTHVIQLGYITGTTENGFINHGGASTSFDPNVLTTADQLIAINFGTTYQIYENFSTTFAVGYIHALKRNGNWANVKSMADDDVSVGMGFRYAF